MGSAAARRRPPTAQQFVLGELRRAITSGELRPGAPIRQVALAERLTVSRVPLREALKMLEAEGLVAHHAHRGYFVTELSLADLREIYRIRQLLEEEAVRAAFARMADDAGLRATLLRAMEAAQAEVEQAARAEDIPAMTAANRRFHFSLIEASGLPRLVRLIGTLWDTTDAYRSLYYVESDNRERVVHEHREVIDALEFGVADAAVRWLDRHRDHAVDRLREIIGPEPPA
ncbi:GntR family transcriptional regulator [Streptomyces sp. B1866]|uniref:GntR family transcriptional regulator n=1 Tax=Streptomyces sp. B1866 TaxID=3075431 RepID=UPI00289181FD|nr:GntR family transcriptional regulator [Streptomyces sp. B1866]MDT3395367.1 GntR family transcriptional regulator [Streptomyces sp. B1866]